MNWNLVGSIYGRSFIKIAHLARSINKHGRHRQFLFLIGRFLNKSSPLKPHGQMNQNLVGSILGRFSIKFAHLVPIHWQTWPPQAILVFDWLISKKILLWNAFPNEMKFGRKHLWKVLYKDCSFCPDHWQTCMAATGNSCFWLTDF